MVHGNGISPGIVLRHEGCYKILLGGLYLKRFPLLMFQLNLAKTCFKLCIKNWAMKKFKYKTLGIHINVHSVNSLQVLPEPLIW